MTITANATPTKVAVTGASGKTGKLVVKRLLQQPELYTAVAVVRSEGSASALTSFLGDLAASLQVATVNVVGNNAEASLRSTLQGCSTLVIATSAVPVLKPLSLVTVRCTPLTTAGAMLCPCCVCTVSACKSPILWH